MAFTGTATVKQTTDRMVRITGLSLAAGAAGTIGLTGATGSTPGVTLPASFKTLHFVYNGVTVTFQDCIDLIVNCAATGVATAIPIAIVKSGTSLADFRITVTNTHGSLATPALELVVRLHD